ncbi:unnamed protein product [Durusdinium trenchii]|uniref:Uncharacterized protein n=1 Tax=Durusdinium trenchii TaxID=1381693 RepID=A0ABP0L778_9DINO
MRTLPALLLLTDVAQFGHTRSPQRQRTGLASFDAGGHFNLEGPPPTPFCQKLCNKSNIDLRGAKTCKELPEEDCKALGFYQKKQGEYRLCIWQPQWKCTEDWTTACLLSELQCDGPTSSARGFCHSLCYKTDLRSIDSFCHLLSPEECSSGQFYESDGDGNRRECKELSGSDSISCVASSQAECPGRNITCPGNIDFEQSEELNSSECRSMCYRTNTAVSGLSCADLSLAHCSSAQFYESDRHGHRRLCVPHGNRCAADPARSCSGNVAPCSDDRSHPASSLPPLVFTTTAASSLANSSERLLANEVPHFCLSLCEKTDTRSMNASCADLPAASCESQDFYETDSGGKRRLCYQSGGKCLQDSSKVCDEQYSLCRSGHAEANSLELNGCYLYCDKINTRSRNKSCEDLSEMECLSGIFYQSDHEGTRIMCSSADKGCFANVSTSCEANRPICHGLDSKPRKASVVPVAVHSYGGSPAHEAFGGAEVHSGAARFKMCVIVAALCMVS